jgi:tetratricopeptide (TPR) repeat protein
MAMMMADWMLGVSHHLLGDQTSARKHCETSLKPAPIQKPSLIRSGYDQRIRAQLTLARALWLEGYATRAVTVATQALDQATVLDHPLSICLCGIYRVTLFVWTGDWSGAEGIIDSLIAYAEKYSLRCHHAISLGLKGELSLRQGDADAALRLLSSSLNALETVQHQTMTPVFISGLAIGLARVGRPDEADAAVDEAMAFGPHFYLPEIMRIKGELLASGSYSSEAEYWFSRSLDLAREQSALAWELRAATSLAHLRARQGRDDDALRILRPVYDRFSEGFDTLDLRVAKRLLDDLR